MAGLLQFIDRTQTSNETYLFSGSRGSGKTIELNQLIAELRDRNIAAYYCDASVYLNLNDPKLSLAELLMTALAGLSDALRKKLLRDWPKGFVFYLIFGDNYRVADETLRLHEYSPGFDPHRFAAHERFFVDDIGTWVRSHFGVTLSAERTAVFGVSAGGEFALAIGLRHAQRYGVIFAGSPGAGYRPPTVLPTPLPRTYLVAGTLEPFFLDNAARWRRALRDAAADVVMTERVAGHDDAMWRAEFPLMVAWAFGS